MLQPSPISWTCRIYFEWEDDIASTGVAGACLPFLCGYRDLSDPPEKVLEALKRPSVSRKDEPLLKVQPFRKTLSACDLM